MCPSASGRPRFFLPGRLVRRAACFFLPGLFFFFLRLPDNLGRTGKADIRQEIDFLFSAVFRFGLRIFPSNPLLPNKQDFPLLKWI